MHLLQRLGEPGALSELAALLRRGRQLLGWDRVIALHAELRAERAGFFDRALNPLAAGHHLPFFTGTPRLRSSALSRLEPSLMPCARSYASSWAGVHGLPVLGLVRPRASAMTLSLDQRLDCGHVRDRYTVLFDHACFDTQEIIEHMCEMRAQVQVGQRRIDGLPVRDGVPEGIAVIPLTSTSRTGPHAQVALPVSPRFQL